jgi:asparagine synthase (glutamine-hydrolysing)
MCGLAGFVDFNTNTDNSVLHKMTDVIHYRGPDDQGHEFFGHKHAKIGLGFRRLSIIDITISGHQPMFSRDRELCIIFNGEIYNFLEIKKILIAEGFPFISNSDTEVILYSYRHWGESCVNHFNGMFAIAIYDSSKSKLVCFRDRAGVKPFYYYFKNGYFLFGSELKVILQHPMYTKELNQTSISDYFSRGYISHTQTIYKDTFKLEAGSMLTLDLDTKDMNVSPYWKIEEEYRQAKTDMSYSEAKSELELQLIKAFTYRLISDVPVGIFLSGGYDSSAVAALLQKHSSQTLKTFTIGFYEKEFDEAKYAKEVSQIIGTDHYSYICTPRDALEIIPTLPNVFDEPFGDTSCIPTMLLSKFSREQVVVALSADGADELFAGYSKYANALQKIHSLEKYRKFTFLLSLLQGSRPKQGKQFRIGKLQEYYSSKNIEEKFDIISKLLSRRELNELLHTNTSFNNFTIEFNRDFTNLEILQIIDFKTYLRDDILQKVDKSTMYYSLEGREPFLDPNLIHFVTKLPNEYKLHNGISKRILKDIVHQYLPRTIMDRPKMGFGIPLEKWLKNELNELFQELFDDTFIVQQGLFKPSYIKDLKKAFLTGQSIPSNRVNNLFLFQNWWKTWM